MEIAVVTLFPQMFDALADYGITSRALKSDVLRLTRWNPRDYAHDRHHTVDDRPYGGGPGMVMQVQPLCDAIDAARGTGEDRAHVVYLTPQGRRFNQAGAKTLAAHARLVLVAGRYEGIDERVIATHVDAEWSIGDYVLSGGELATMVMIDAITRLLPGALGHEDSALQDSFSAGLLDTPHYTRPEEVDGLRVPEVLLSGDHRAIARWRAKQSLGRTWLRRPDLLEDVELTQEQRNLLDEFIKEQN